ncbi:MAG: ferrous iron transport protein A [Flavobacteriales bacterium]|nr:ferrous iron transport protein A [Flavobacteriales bacterium]
MRLSELHINANGTITDILDNPVINKLFEFGILPGVQFSIVSIAPYKGPICIKVDDELIALRNQEAKNIIVE